MNVLYVLSTDTERCVCGRGRAQKHIRFRRGGAFHRGGDRPKLIHSGWSMRSLPELEQLLHYCISFCVLASNKLNTNTFSFLTGA